MNCQITQIKKILLDVGLPSTSDVRMPFAIGILAPLKRGKLWVSVCDRHPKLK